MRIKKTIVLLMLFLVSRGYSLDIKNIYFTPSFSSSYDPHFFGGIRLFGGSFSIDKDFYLSKRFSLNIGLAYSIRKTHHTYTTIDSSSNPSPTSGLLGFYSLGREVSQLFLPISIKYFITISGNKKLSVSLGVVPLYYLTDKGYGTYYQRPFITYPFAPGPFSLDDNYLDTRRYILSISNSISLEYCCPISSKLAINFRATVMKGIYTEEPFIPSVGIGIKLI